MSIVEEQVQATMAIAEATLAKAEATTAKPEAVRAKVDDEEFPEIQKLALTGYDFDAVLHLVLRISNTDKARQWLSEMLQSGLFTFSDRPRDRDYAINIGLTYRGLVKLGLPEGFSQQLARKAPAFYQGAPSRAPALGDSGESAAERWERPFRFEFADVLICIYGKDSGVFEQVMPELIALPGAREGFDGWDSKRMTGQHLNPDPQKKPDPQNRRVHFGFRDSVSRPVVSCSLLKDGKPKHSAGELLLGYANDADFNRWRADKVTPEGVARFFRNGTFAILRKIEQHEDRFDQFLTTKVAQLQSQATKGLPTVDAELIKYLKAKLCGRWPNGARVLPGQTTEPPEPTWEELQNDSEFDFTDDPNAEGCPFGAHIRRASPRRDKVLPERRRPLFRRGVPYTYRSSGADGKERVERGLFGLFFCASIEDQFEHVLSEWMEKMPMGPRSRGNAKDPIAGQHDGSDTEFHIPGNAGGILLDGFDKPFITTRGTLYALFPSKRALQDIAAFVGSP